MILLGDESNLSIMWFWLGDFFQTDGLYETNLKF
jgi:hypothetical protein